MSLAQQQLAQGRTIIPMSGGNGAPTRQQFNQLGSKEHIGNTNGDDDEGHPESHQSPTRSSVQS